VGVPAFDALSAGNVLPGDTAQGWRPVAKGIAALNAAPVTSELAAEAGALTVFPELSGCQTATAEAGRLSNTSFASTTSTPETR
jgi:hypothetical protein